MTKNTNMKKGGITQENTCGKARSRENKTKKLAKRVHIRKNSTRRDASALKESTAAHNATKVEGILALVE